MSETLTIHHDLGDVILKPNKVIDPRMFVNIIRAALDEYQTDNRVSASHVHEQAQLRHGIAYRTPGHYLRVYRLRSDMTQQALAKQAEIHQHHLSEMENNKRPLGKVMAKKIAKILDCDYQKLL